MTWSPAGRRGYNAPMARNEEKTILRRSEVMCEIAISRDGNPDAPVFHDFGYFERCDSISDQQYWFGVIDVFRTCELESLLMEPPDGFRVNVTLKHGEQGTARLI